MRRIKTRIAILYGVGLLAVLLPIGAAVLLAEYRSFEQQKDRANRLASEILHRTHRVTEQMAAVFQELNATQGANPCSDANLDLMRKLVVKSNLLIDVGYVENNQMRCSSFGRNEYRVGPPSYRGDGGYDVRAQLEHPLLPGSRLVMSTDPKTGFSTLIHQGAVLEVAPADSRLTYGLVGVRSKSAIVSHGAFDPLWLANIGGTYETTFFDGNRIISWKRSDRYDLAAYVAIPRSEIDHDSGRAMLVLVPVGIGAGLVLALVVAQLVRLQRTLSTALRDALKNDEFFLAYQPIVDLASGRWVGAEALLRWRNVNGMMVSPDVFIPEAERSHLIERVTERVVQLLVQDAADLLRERPDFHIAINLSAQDFSNADLPERLRGACAHMRVHPRSLHIEATERVFLDVGQTRKTVAALRAQGHVVSIDDFGTGYSSLSYLTEFELDCLKIDKCFVSTIGTQAVTRNVIGHIIEMAKSLQLRMIAEGVETQEQATYLREHGVEFAQGWLYAKAMDIRQLVQELNTAET
ncbi:MAG: EAL domain-containing protein [Gammaproteobacteria bacterium]|jgi:sensor c-di-GMP phosphodiesterase-like protein|nr:EAL domain-containing protein [Gammaproteobacteria bacterium]MBU0892970.1 EAL domain-containing protein [Gammaproteobacteria bacterium]